MKKILLIIALIVIIKITLVIIFAEPVAVVIAKYQIGRVLPGSKVSIGRCRAEFGRSLAFSDITIKKGKDLNITVKEAGVMYGLDTLVKGRVRLVYSKGLDIVINMPSVKLSGVGGKLGLRPGGRAFGIKQLDISDLRLSLNTKDVNVAASLSASFDMRELFPKRIGLKVDRLICGGVNMEGLKIDVAAGDRSGDLSIASARYNKIVLRIINARPSLGVNRFSLEVRDGRIFNGSVRGALNLIAAKGRQDYHINLEFAGLDSGEIIKELDLADKAEARGLIKGSLAMEGDANGIRLLKGAFVAEGEGGSFVIKDESILKSIAERTKQPLEIIRESFRDYSYSKGSTWLYLEERNLRLGASLEGDKGRRDVDVIIHEFK